MGPPIVSHNCVVHAALIRGVPPSMVVPVAKAALRSRWPAKIAQEGTEAARVMFMTFFVMGGVTLSWAVMICAQSFCFSYLLLCTAVILQYIVDTELDKCISEALLELLTQSPLPANPFSYMTLQVSYRQSFHCFCSLVNFDNG